MTIKTMTNKKTEQITEDMINKADADIMDVFYQWTEINFGEEVLFQDSTQIRKILIRLVEETRKEERNKVQIEHCAEPNCPECHRTAYEAGRPRS